MDNVKNSNNKLGVKEIKEQIGKGMKEGLEKDLGYKGAFKNLGKSKPVEDLKKEIWKRAEKEREIMEHKGVADHQRKKSLKEEYRDDRIRIKDLSARQTAALKYKKEAEKEAEEEADRRLKEIGIMQSGIKRKVVSKMVGRATSEMAYRVAQKMSEAANRGGIYATTMILLTLLMALYTDIVDVLVEIIGLIIVLLGIASVAGIPIGIVTGAIGIIVWISNFFVSLIIIFFWMFALGGGHTKWFWKIIIRLIIGLLIAESIPYLDLLPIATFMVCWNWHDFAKEKRKANKDLAEFQDELRATGKISKKHVKNYA